MGKPNILIIGGGIGGLMTAIALNRKGITTTIYEKAPAFDTNGAGLALWPNATKLLHEAGLLKELLPHGTMLYHMKASTASGNTLSVLNLKKLETLYKVPSLVLLRSDLQQVLQNAVPASQVRFNKHCVRIERHSHTTTVHFSDGTSETPDALIFADGIHSLARSAVFKQPPLQYAGRTSWRGVAQFDKSPFDNTSSFEILGHGKRIGIFPLPGNKAYWYAAVNMPEAQAFEQTRTIAGVHSHFEGWSEPVKTLFENTPEHRLILTNINHTTAVPKLATENIALLGDAAHPMTPDLGQGACQAIEDAWTLAECLEHYSPISEAFRNYESKRMKRTWNIAQKSYSMGRVRQLDHPVAVAVRNTMFKVVPEAIALKILARNIGG